MRTAGFVCVDEDDQLVLTKMTEYVNMNSAPTKQHLMNDHPQKSQVPYK